jgi:aminomethyltransferase
MREGVEIAAGEDGPAVGRITSGGFSPVLSAPIAMGYVEAAHAAPGTPLVGRLRGKSLPVTVTALPFIKPGYKR